MALPLIVLEGAVVRVPELRFAQSGKPWVNLRVVAKDRKRGQDGSWEDGDACFIDVVAFGRDAENIAETFTDTGMRAVVVGRLQQNDYTKDDGTKVTGYRVTIGFDGSVTPATRWDSWSKNGATRTSSPATANDPWASPATDEPPY
jgi:single stranded DNA-binding protein